MARQKTSKAVIKSVRLNPINKEERTALEIIQRLEDEGFNFKQIVVDAILYADGRSPEMFSKTDTQGLFAHMEALLEQFAQEIIHATRRAGPAASEEETGGESTAFVKNFARGFLERQSQALGDEE